MEYVAILLAVAVLGGLAVWTLRRRRSDEMHSVAGYQHRRERLEEVRRRQGGSVRVIGSTPPRLGPDAQPGVGEHGRMEISSSTSRRRVFDDASPPPDSGRPPPPTTYRRRRDSSIARMSHRPRRLGAPIAAAVAVIVLVTGLAIAGAHSRSPGTSTSTTVKVKVKKSHRSGTTQPTHATTTTTTVPTTFSPTSTNETGATYSLPFASYTVTFDASSGACYVQVTNSSGSTPYAQTLNQGSTEKIVLSGTSKVTLGAPSDVTVQIDGTPVAFPTPLPAPLHLTFEGVASTTTTSTP
jgi:hypothetical protein